MSSTQVPNIRTIENTLTIVCQDEAGVARATQVAWDVIRQFELFPTFMPEIVPKVTVIEEGNNWTKTQWLVYLNKVPYEWTAEDNYFPEKLRIESRAHPNARYNQFSAFWQIDHSDKNVRIQHFMCFELKPHIDKMNGPVTEVRMKQTSSKMVEAITARINLLLTES